LDFCAIAGIAIKSPADASNVALLNVMVLSRVTFVEFAIIIFLDARWYAAVASGFITLPQK
jgi:hypothetical protein